MVAKNSPDVAAGADATLPEFSNPPVNETALSVQFAPIRNMTIAHLGLYWGAIRSRFPKSQVHGTLPNIVEQFDVPFRPLRLGVQLIAHPEARCWFLDDSETRLIQVQPDRFIHNWRKVSGAEAYPRYPAIRDSLKREWAAFCDFLESEQLARPQVNQCEVTYVNHIEYSKGWSNYGELSRVLSLWSGHTSGDFLPPPERASVEAHYCLPDTAGRLHVSIEPVIRTRDGAEVLQLTLTARGAPQSSSNEDIFGWMNLGREWVVKGFSDLTTADMHQLWGRKK